MVRRRWGLAGGVVLLAWGLCGISGISAHAAAPPVGMVRAIDGAALKKAVAAHPGKVVVLNFWATWCGPCIEEFPHFVKLSQLYGKRGVVVLAASMDEPEDKPAVLAFAKKHKTSFPMFMRATGSMDQFINPIDPKFRGALPATYIFGRDGKLTGRPFGGVKSFSELETAVKPYVK